MRKKMSTTILSIIIIVFVVLVIIAIELKQNSHYKKSLYHDKRKVYK